MADEFFCSNGFEDLTVDLIRVSHEEPFEMFWDWFKETWLGLQDQPFDRHNPEHIKAAIDVVNRRALPTPMEVLSFEVRITGLSRVGLAQITRGRVGHCYNVQSQMPQHIRHQATIPKNIYQHPMFASRAQEIQASLAELYDDMYEAGIPPQDCRYMTLHGQQTSLMWNVNFGALLGWFARRCENGLTDELNTVGRKLRRLLIDKFLQFSHDGNENLVDRVPGSGWSYLIDKLDCIGAPQDKCVNSDLVFGNTGRHASAGDWVPSTINETTPANYRFDMSAFYLELLEMDRNLLFPGEEEMINDWREIGFKGRLEKLSGDK